MNCGVCHFAKYSKGSVKGIEIHNQREKDGVSHTNPDIDWNKTSDNYELHNSGPVNYHAAIQQRIKQLDLPKAVRKDAVVLGGFIVTSSPDFFKGKKPGEIKSFFTDSYNFLAQRYGKENVVYSTVHLDERTPHMHVGVVPITPDGRLSAKSIFTKTHLRNLHDEFYKHVGKRWNLERGEVGSKAKHVETIDYKIKAAAAKLDSLEAKILTAEQVQGIEIKKPLLGKPESVISLPYQDAINLKKTALAVDKAIKEKNEILDNAEEIRCNAWKQEKQIIAKAKKQAAGEIEKARVEISGMYKAVSQDAQVVQQLKHNKLKVENEALRGAVSQYERFLEEKGIQDPVKAVRAAGRVLGSKKDLDFER